MAALEVENFFQTNETFLEKSRRKWYWPVAKMRVFSTLWGLMYAVVALPELAITGTIFHWWLSVPLGVVAFLVSFLAPHLQLKALGAVPLGRWLGRLDWLVDPLMIDPLLQAERSVNLEFREMVFEHFTRKFGAMRTQPGKLKALRTAVVRHGLLILLESPAIKIEEDEEKFNEVVELNLSLRKVRRARPLPGLSTGVWPSYSAFDIALESLLILSSWAGFGRMVQLVDYYSQLYDNLGRRGLPAARIMSWYGKIPFDELEEDLLGWMRKQGVAETIQQRILDYEGQLLFSKSDFEPATPAFSIEIGGAVAQHLSMGHTRDLSLNRPEWGKETMVLRRR